MMIWRSAGRLGCKKAQYFYERGCGWNSPYINHFIQPDSIIPDQTNPQAWDRYAYVLNNPIRYTDPLGHKACNFEGRGSCTISSEPFSFGQVVSRLQHYGVKVTGKWNFENLSAAFAGVDTIGRKLAQSVGRNAETAFRRAFTAVTFQWVDGACGAQTDRCYADAKSFPKTIKFYSKWWAGVDAETGHTIIKATPPVNISLTVHELGHAFNSRTGGIFNQDVSNKGIIDKTGLGLTVGADGQSEVTADLFTNYILGTFTGSGTGGTDLQLFMQTNIERWNEIASAP